MKMNHLQNFFTTIYPDLFGLSFCLVPDDLHASQIALDAANALTIKDRGLIQDLLVSKSNINAQSSRELLRKTLLGHVYNIGKRRSGQLGSSHQISNEFFYKSVGTTERAVLFLKHRLMLKNSEIELIVSKDSMSVLAILSSARELCNRELKKIGNGHRA